MMKINFFLFSFFVAVFCFSSCSKSKTEQAHVVIEEYILDNMNDPDSYEFKEIALVDTITLNEVINFKYESFQESMNSILEFKDTQIELNEGYKKDKERSLKNEKYESVKEIQRETIKRYEKEIAELQKEKKQEETKYKERLSKIDKFRESRKNELDDFVVYVFEYSYRGNNALGNKRLNKSYFHTDQNYKPFKVTDSKTRYFYEKDFQELVESMVK